MYRRKDPEDINSPYTLASYNLVHSHPLDLSLAVYNSKIPEF